MQGTIFQILVLVTHGNMVLSSLPVASFYPEHEAFRFDEFVRFVDFERIGSTWNEHLFADNPNDWLTKLKNQRYSGLRVNRISTDRKGLSDRMSVGFIGGGGRWLIEAVHPDGSDYWEAKWEVGDRGHFDRKIWRVTYMRIARHQKSSPAQTPTVDRLSTKMSRALQDAIAFSKRHQLDIFRAAFESGYSTLKAESESELNRISLKGQLPRPASRLLAASQAAWVFGGMGTWNDLCFDGDDQQQYEIISDNLFQLINLSIIATVNLSCPETKKPFWRFWQ